MMLLYAAPEATVANEATGRVLARHLRNRAFDTLRTEEQLGYAPVVSPRPCRITR